MPYSLYACQTVFDFIEVPDPFGAVLVVDLLRFGQVV